MKFRVEIVCMDGTGQEQRHPVLTIERDELVMENLGLSLSEGKTLLASVQEVVVAQQVPGLNRQVRVMTGPARFPVGVPAKLPRLPG